ncbi:MAG: TIGR01244 family phosphatase [Agarilytica sp.]
MHATYLTENYAVSPQISPELVSLLKQEGFDAIVCNRPDNEDAGQPSFSAIAEAASTAGMEAFHIPMMGPNFSQDDLAKLKEIIASKSKIFAFCRSGNRSSILWKAAQ